MSKCIHMYVCMHMHVIAYVYVYVYVFAYVYVYVYVYVHVCFSICTWIYLSIYITMNARGKKYTLTLKPSLQRTVCILRSLRKKHPICIAWYQWWPPLDFKTCVNKPIYIITWLISSLQWYNNSDSLKMIRIAYRMIIQIISTGIKFLNNCYHIYKINNK